MTITIHKKKIMFTKKNYYTYVMLSLQKNYYEKIKVRLLPLSYEIIRSIGSFTEGTRNNFWRLVIVANRSDTVMNMTRN